MPGNTVKMTEAHVTRRIRESSNPSPRDVAWAQLKAPGILKNLHVDFLPPEKLDLVTQLYVNPGFDAGSLNNRDHLIDEAVDGSWSLPQASFAPTTNEPNDLHSNTSHIFNSMPAKPLTKISARPRENAGSKVKARVDGAATVSPGRKTVQNPDTIGIPISNLKRKYGVLDIEDGSEEPDNGAVAIPHDQIPVGVYRDDLRTLGPRARLITATIDIEERNLQYTIQACDKSFTRISVEGIEHDSTAPMGETWQSSRDITIDAQRIAFTRTLGRDSWLAALDYVFTELRTENNFDNPWQSAADMLANPALLALHQSFIAFANKKSASGSPDDVSVTEAIMTFNKTARIFSGLGDIGKGQSDVLAQLQQEAENDGSATPILKGINGMWKEMGLAFERMLAARRDPDRAAGGARWVSG